MKKRALISVSDKNGVVDLAGRLIKIDWEVVSTGNTAKAIHEAGLSAIKVADITGFPEMMDGRVKTLHPAVHGGILARRNEPEDMAALLQHNIGLFDLVVVNLYPFRETIAKPGVTFAEAVEKIDIGGPAMIRSAAKNLAFVGVVVSPRDYDPVIRELETTGVLSSATRRRLAVDAFLHTTEYDSAIYGYLSDSRNQ